MQRCKGNLTPVQSVLADRNLGPGGHGTDRQAPRVAQIRCDTEAPSGGAQLRLTEKTGDFGKTASYGPTPAYSSLAWHFQQHYSGDREYIFTALLLCDDVDE